MVMVRATVVVGYPRIDFCFNFFWRLIGSGPGFVHHLVIWFARVLLLWFGSSRFDPLPRCPHCIAHLLARSHIIIVQHPFG